MAGRIEREIHQTKAVRSPHEEALLNIVRTADLLSMAVGTLLKPHGLSGTQYNVLRILRGAGDEGLPTLVIRDRMIHAAPGITRLLDKLEKAGLARRERTSPDRRQVFCYISDKGLAILDELDEEMRDADEAAVGDITEAEQKQLLKLLEAVRSRHPGKKS